MPTDIKRLMRYVRVAPGRVFRLDSRRTDLRDIPDLAALAELELKGRAKDFVEAQIKRLSEAQELLWASDTRSVLVVLQAMDAAGKDGLIRHVMSGVNPQGCSVHSFKAPTDHELDRSYLWRAMIAAPERGKIVIFNRSHYEDVLITRVHPGLLERTKLPRELLPRTANDRAFWRSRYEDINAFEQHLARNGTTVLKFFLHVSKAEQKKRFLDRLEHPEKRWKFSPADVRERQHWDRYMRAYEDCLAATSTACAPWFVIPADDKWVTRAMVSGILAHEIGRLKLHLPQITADERREMRECKERLLREPD